MQLYLNKSKSQGHAGKRNPISVDKMYSSQPISTSLSVNNRRRLIPLNTRLKVEANGKRFGCHKTVNEHTSQSRSQP
jgi:hypothetical protein